MRKKFEQLKYDTKSAPGNVILVRSFLVIKNRFFFLMYTNSYVALFFMNQNFDRSKISRIVKFVGSST